MAPVTIPSPTKRGPDLAPLRIARSAGGTVVRRGGRFAWVLLVGLLGGLGWAYATGRLVLGPSGEAGTPVVETSLVAGGTPAVAGPREEKANGYIVARKRAALSTVLSGRLVEVNVTEGQSIPLDFVVARIQHDDYDAALARAQTDVVLATARKGEVQKALDASRLDLGRLESDNAVLDELVRQARAEADRTTQDLVRNEPLRGRVVDGASWDRMKAAASAAHAALEAALARVKAGTSAVTAWNGEIARREAALAVVDAEIARARDAKHEAEILLEKTFVRAPFAGLVIRKDAEVGEVVAATGAGGNSRGSVATIVDPASFEAQVEPSESRLPRLAEGDRVLVMLEASPTIRIPGKIRQVWPTADRQKATVEVRISLDEKPSILRPEMGVLVTFFGKDAPATPVSAVDRPRVAARALVNRTGAVATVFVVEGDTLRRREVRLLGEKGGDVEVESGLAGGERVVLSPGSTLSDGAKIRVKEAR